MKKLWMAVGLGTVFAAQAQVLQSVEISTEGVDRTTTSSAHGQLADQATQNGSTAGVPFQTSVWATSSAGPGALTASTYASFDGPGSARASSSASLYDVLTFDDGNSSELLTVRYSLMVVGGSQSSIDASPERPYWGGSTSWSAYQSLGSGSTFLGAYTGIFYDGTTDTRLSGGLTSPVVAQMFTFETQVRPGSRNVLELTLKSDVSLNVSHEDTAGDGGSLFTQSLYWGGISTVTRADGSLVDYTLASQSGTDWSRSFVPSSVVPEPSAAWLAVAGLAALGGLGRRRAARPVETATA